MEDRLSRMVAALSWQDPPLMAAAGEAEAAGFGGVARGEESGERGLQAARQAQVGGRAGGRAGICEGLSCCSCFWEPRAKSEALWEPVGQQAAVALSAFVGAASSAPALVSPRPGPCAPLAPEFGAGGPSAHCEPSVHASVA